MQCPISLPLVSTWYNSSQPTILSRARSGHCRWLFRLLCQSGNCTTIVCLAHVRAAVQSPSSSLASISLLRCSSQNLHAASAFQSSFTHSLARNSSHYVEMHYLHYGNQTHVTLYFYCYVLCHVIVSFKPLVHTSRLARVLVRLSNWCYLSPSFGYLSSPWLIFVFTRL